MTSEPSRFQVDLQGAELLGRYQVKEALGRGGMATVYLGHDDTLDIPVVVKVPHVALLAEPGFRERFQQEIQDLIKLQHPHIVTILARGEFEEMPFLVQQYLSGGSLDDRLERAQGRRLSLEEVEPWIRDVASALDFMHERGVIHRDVKPGNILFDEHGYVYLSDFGIAKAIGEQDTGLTATGMTPGSPLYMAPEQARESVATGRSDQYALASTVFEALSGRPPFEGHSVVDVLLKKSAGEAPPLRTIVPALAPHAAVAVARALSRNAEARFDTCRTFADALLTTDVATTVVPAAPAPRPPPPPSVVEAPFDHETTSFVTSNPGTSSGSTGANKTIILALSLVASLLFVVIGVTFRSAEEPDDSEGEIMFAAPEGGVSRGVPVPAGGFALGEYVPDWKETRRRAPGNTMRRGSRMDLTLDLRADGTFSLDMRTRKRMTGPWRTRAAAGQWSLKGDDEIHLELESVDGDALPGLSEAVLRVAGERQLLLELQRETFVLRHR